MLSEAIYLIETGHKIRLDHMDKDKFNILIQKYQNGELQGKQKSLIDEWFDHLNVDEKVRFDQETPPKLLEKIWMEIDEATENPKIFGLARRWVPYAAALALLILSAGGYWMFWADRGVVSQTATSASEIRYPEDIAPGGNKATLTLSDGRTVELKGDQDGIETGGGLTYLDGTPVIDQEHFSADYAILEIPRGGQYRVTLPDGSRVWLNSESTLRYPLRFAGERREVELEGEAYFEVTRSVSAEDRLIPFYVNTRTQIVEVIGTEFNISAYPGETETRTTLVAGVVKTFNPQTNRSNRLTPGQESVSTQEGIQVRQANVEAAIAWKSGVFYFDDTPFPQMIAEIARWYDIDVRYRDREPAETFSGKMSRNVNLGVLIDFLEGSGIRLQIEGRQLFVE